MKHFSFTIILAGLVLVACEGPMGPAGVAGTNGNNGTDGTAGKDANNVCLGCHASTNMAAKDVEYRQSKHFTGVTSLSRNTKYCARCHTNEGLKEITSTNAQTLRTTTPVLLNYTINPG
jgi:hypothetical protein